MISKRKCSIAWITLILSLGLYGCKSDIQVSSITEKSEHTEEKELIIADLQKNDLGGGYNSFLESTGLNYEVFGEGFQQEKEEIISYSYIYYDYDDKLQQYSTNPRYSCTVQEMPYEKTALIIIDPWKDSPFEEINNAVAKHVQDYLLPIITHAIDNDICVYIFTNNPETIDYDTKIDDSLQSLVDNNKVFLYYYDDYVIPKKFVKELEKKNIENLVYTGYSTHLCVLYRNTGLMEMYHSNGHNQLNLYIIPEATLAYVAESEDINIQMRNDVCTMLSQQGIAEIITWEDFMRY